MKKLYVSLFLLVVSISSCTKPPSDAPASVYPGIIYIPSAFSPNGDGKNDTLFVRGNTIESINLKIFDSNSGDILFETEDMKKGWDGKCKGKPVSPGTYYYTAYYLTVSGEEGGIKGYVDLVL